MGCKQLDRHYCTTQCWEADNRLEYPLLCKELKIGESSFGVKAVCTNRVEADASTNHHETRAENGVHPAARSRCSEGQTAQRCEYTPRGVDREQGAGEHGSERGGTTPRSIPCCRDTSTGHP